MYDSWTSGVKVYTVWAHEPLGYGFSGSTRPEAEVCSSEVLVECRAHVCGCVCPNPDPKHRVPAPLQHPRSAAYTEYGPDACRELTGSGLLKE